MYYYCYAMLLKIESNILICIQRANHKSHPRLSWRLPEQVTHKKAVCWLKTHFLIFILASGIWWTFIMTKITNRSKTNKITSVFFLYTFSAYHILVTMRCTFTFSPKWTPFNAVRLICAQSSKICKCFSSFTKTISDSFSSFRIQKMMYCTWVDC